MIFLAGCINTPTGNVPLCPDYECQLTTVPAQIESTVIDDRGNGCITDCSAEILIKNKENQPNRVKVTADCETVNGIKSVSSETYWMQPNEEHEFKIKIPVSMMENWVCSNFVIYSDKIYGCQKTPK